MQCTNIITKKLQYIRHVNSTNTKNHTIQTEDNHWTTSTCSGRTSLAAEAWNKHTCITPMPTNITYSPRTTNSLKKVKVDIEPNESRVLPLLYAKLYESNICAKQDLDDKLRLQIMAALH